MSTEEEKLLASFGGVVEDANQYEEDVIQKAQRETAPKLDGHGFPNLVQLGPSHMGSNRSTTINRQDVPHFRTILSKVREELNSMSDFTSRRGKVLRMKEQLILSYLKDVSKLTEDEMPTSLQSELKKEKIWLDGLSKPGIHGNNLTNTKNASLKRKMTSRKGLKSDATNKKLTDSIDKHNSRKRSRKSMMSRKNEGQQKNDAESDDKEMMERRKVLREMRAERQRLRKKRLAILDGVEESKNVIEDESENELEFENETIIEPINGTISNVKEKEVSDGKIEASTDLDQNKIEKDSSNLGGIVSSSDSVPFVTASKIVECPICSQKIECNGGCPDAVLSQHISLCQQNAGRVTRGRSRKNRSNYQIYNDDLELNDDKKTSQSPGQKHNKKKKQSLSKALAPISKSALDDMIETDYEDRVDEWIESGLSKMKEMSERDADETPPGFDEYPGNLFIPAWINNRLFSYQRDGLRWMWDLHQQQAGGIIGDEMGLGKTVQVCSFLGCMACSRKMKSGLIVCPATMLHHWLKELTIWAPGLRRILIHKSGEKDGISRSVTSVLLKNMAKWLKRSRSSCLYEAIDEQDFEEGDADTFVGTGYVFVTTYENLRRSADVWISHKWSYVVLDEGQKIRNPNADVTLACKRLRTPHRLLLSGTPIQNDLKELWTLFDFVFPGRLGTLPAFESEFADPIKKGGYANASPMMVQLAFRCSLILKDLIKPYLLRRQKKDIKEVKRMPGKTEQVLFCRLSKRQRELYEAYIGSDEVRNIIRGSLQLFKAITILRKICNHPDLVCDPDEEAYENFVRTGFNKVQDDHITDDSDEERNDDIECFDSITERSGKMQILAKILPLWQKEGHRVLIFCQWTKMLDYLQQFMMNNGWKFSRMDGKTSVASRQRLVDNFNSDESFFAMLMTTRTGGVGLNLTGANRVVIYDPDWNPQTDSQARARSHRFGQKKAVTIYRLITAGTIEEKIYHRQIFKTALTNRVLQDPKQKRLFSQKDLRDFFTLKADDGSIISGSQGVTELGAITRGKGIINPENMIPDESESGMTDDKETLRTVMKSKGLAGVFDHDFIDSSAGNKTRTTREMEDAAKKVAEEAAKALEKSSCHLFSRFQPTWTGSEKTSSSRFGHGNVASEIRSSYGTQNMGATNIIPCPSNSKNLLSGLKNLKSGRIRSDNNSRDIKMYASLLKRVKDFVWKHGGSLKGGGPTTDEILKEFKDIQDSDAAIFRRLLTSVAKVENGMWYLK